MSGYFFAGSNVSGLTRIARRSLPSALRYVISSAFPQVNSLCCGLAFDTFFMSRKLTSVVQRSGNSSNRDRVRTTRSAFFAFVIWPIDFGTITSFSGAAVPLSATR